MSRKIVVRQARAEDFEAFVTVASRPTVRAWVGELDGDPVIVGGVARGADGRWYAFFDIRDEARFAKKTIVKAARDFFARLDVRYVYAMIDEREKNARAWTERLGFRPDPHSTHLVRWENARS